MTDLPLQYQALLDTRNLAADEVLLATISELRRPYNQWSVDVLLARGQDAALDRLLEKYHELPEACRALIAERAELLEPALRIAIRASNESTRVNALEVVARRKLPSLSYVLGDALSSTLSTVRGRAAMALRDLAAEFADLPKMESGVELSREQLRAQCQRLAQWRAGRACVATTLRKALQCFGAHHRAAVLEASALLSPELDEDLLAEAHKPRSKPWRTICEMICSDPRPGFATLAVQALSVEQARPVISRAISQCQDAAFMTAVMECSWLVCDPRIRAGCSGIVHLTWLEKRPVTLLAMSTELLRKTWRFIRATEISNQAKLAWCRSLLECGQIHQQIFGLSNVILIDDAASTELLRMLADWADPQIAQMAQRELFRRHPTDPHLQNLRRPRGSRPERRIVPPDHCDFDWFLKEYDQLDPEQRSAAGRGLRAGGVDLAGKLTSMLRSADAACRVRAMDMMRTLRLEEALKQQLFQAARDPDRVVRSAAVRSLANLQDRAAHRILIRALEDTDRRVRANAIDALDQLRSRDCVDRIVPCLTDQDHRVRAAAVRALLKLHVREAAQTLLELLRDPSKAHRLSGLWVVEKYGLAGALNQIAELAERDPDEIVRRRARRLLRAHRRAGRSRSSPPAATQRGPTE